MAYTNDQITAALNQIYMQNFGRSYNPATDQYWANQLTSGKEFLSDPYKLARDVVSGAQNNDLNYYNTSLADIKANQPTQSGMTNQQANAIGGAQNLGAAGFSDTSIPVAYGILPTPNPQNAAQLAQQASQLDGLPPEAFAAPQATPEELASYKPATDSSKWAYTPTSQLPSTDVGYLAELASARSNPIIEDALQGAADLKLPGFGVKKRGGSVTNKKPSDSFVTFNSNRR
jgi:hypothetical protein